MRTLWGPLLIIFLFSLTVRFIFFFHSKEFFPCPPPTLDEDFYYFLVKLTHEGSSLVYREALYYSPLYMYVLYLLSLFSDRYIELIKYGNILLGSVNTALLSLILYRLFNLRGAFLVFLGVAIALIDALLFYDTTALKVTLGMFFILMHFVFMLSNRFFLGGVFIALGSLIYGGVLLYAFSIIAYELFKKRLKEVVSLLIPLLAVLGTSLSLNLIRAQDFVLLNATEGMHFFIGNWKRATGTYTSVPGVRPNPFGHYFDAREIAQVATGRKLKPSEVSRFWKRLAFRHMLEDKVKASKRFLNKLVYSFSYRYIPNNYNIGFVRERTLLGLTVPFWVFLITGLAGFVIYFSGRKAVCENFIYINFFYITYLIFLITYFVTDRYRLPLIIPSIIYTVLILKNLDKWKYVFTLLVAVLIILYAVKPPFAKTDEFRLGKTKQVCTLKLKAQTINDKTMKSRLFTALAKEYMLLKGYEWAEHYALQALKLNPFNREAREILLKVRFLN